MRIGWFPMRRSRPVAFICAVPALICAARIEVETISFTGNEAFNRSALLERMDLRPAGMFRSSTFSRLTLEADLARLESFYHGRGFVKAHVRADVETAPGHPDRRKITVVIKEGARVIVRSVGIEPNPVTGDSVPSFLRTRRDTPLIMADAESDARDLTDTLRAAGFLLGSARSRVRIDSSAMTGEVQFEIRAGPRILVDTIRIEGAPQVHPAAVLRELTFKKGDTLGGKAVRFSERRLYRTGLFRFVRIRPFLDEGIDTPAVRDTAVPVVISLDKTDFFMLEGGIGYSSMERFRTSSRFSYANLFARGHRITLSGAVSGLEQKARLAYTTPWLLVFPLQTEWSAFYRRHDSLFFSPPMGFTGEFAGGRLSVGQVNDIGFSWRVAVQYENVLRLWAPLLDSLPEDVPIRDTRSLEGQTAIDRRNDPFAPTRGWYARLQSEIAGLSGGATNKFVKFRFDIRGYYDFGRTILWASGLELGWAGPYGEVEFVPPQEQFYAGGARSVRGYEHEHLIVDRNNNPSGGNVLLVAHLADISFPLFWWVRGALFADAGYVWRELGTASSGDIKYGAGPGLRLQTPVALFRFEAGFKLNPGPGRETGGVYYLDVGRPF